MRKIIYYSFVKNFGSYWRQRLFRIFSQILESIFGLAIFKYGNIKLLAGPVSFLDRYIIRGENINPLVTSAIKQCLQKDGVFLDIGANHGVFSIIAAQNPRVQVFSFEPVTRELNRLWKNLALNKVNNVSVMAFALGNADKHQAIALGPAANPGLNSLPNLWHSKNTEVCHFSTLMNVLSPNILSKTRVCKLDVEGQEMTILESLRTHIQWLRQSVFIIEITPDYLSKLGYQAKDIYEFFSAAGFKAQFGMQTDEQWDDIFYHPDFNAPVLVTEEI